MNQTSRRCHEVEGAPNLLVDAFRTHKSRTTGPRTAFVLTHYHGDHYSGLPRDGGYVGPALIHCTHITAELLREVHGVSKEWVVGHAYGEAWTVPAGDKGSGAEKVPSEVVEVTFLDANHCPGAAIIFVRLSDGRCQLHTGDMRYCPAMQECAPLKEAALSRQLDVVYLDTTYGHPKHDFATQGEAVESIATAAAHLLAGVDASCDEGGLEGKGNGGDDTATKLTTDCSLESSKGKTLVLLSCYSIGKEKVLAEVSRRTSSRIYANERKQKMMKCVQIGSRACGIEMDNPESTTSNIMDFFTADPAQSDIHIISMGLAGELWPFFRPNYNACAEYASSQANGYSRVVAFIPTGWADASNWNRKNAVSQRRVHMNDISKYKEVVKGDTKASHDDTTSAGFIDVEIRLIPYSEHSTFSELRSFVEFLRPRSVVPTVFSDEKHYIALEKRFNDLIDDERAKLAFFSSMTRKRVDLPGGEVGKREAKRSVIPPDNDTVEILSSEDENILCRSHSSVGKKRRTDGVRDDFAGIPAGNGDCCHENINALITMGFDRATSRSALQSSNGNIERAVEMMLSSSQQPETHSTNGGAKISSSLQRSRNSDELGSTDSTRSITHFFRPKGR